MRKILGSSCLVDWEADLFVFTLSALLSNRYPILQIHDREGFRISLPQHSTQNDKTCSFHSVMQKLGTLGFKFRAEEGIFCLVVQCIALFYSFVLLPCCFNGSKNSPSQHGSLCWGLSAWFPGNFHNLTKNKKFTICT